MRMRPSATATATSGLFELAAYVNDQVPTITMNAFHFEQIPQVSMVGTDFPIGVVTATAS